MNNRVFLGGHDGCLILNKTGEIIPESEPVFILRARDRKALGTIRCYQALFSPVSEQWKVVQAVIDDFAKFQEENPSLVGESDECY